MGKQKRLYFFLYYWWEDHTSVGHAVAVGNRVVGEEPMAQHGEGVDVHPLVLGEALAHTQHGEEISRHRSVQLRCRHRLIENTKMYNK